MCVMKPYGDGEVFPDAEYNCQKLSTLYKYLLRDEVFES